MTPEAASRDGGRIEAAIDRICTSPGFRRSARLQRFLRFLATVQSTSGHGPKEYEIATQVYDKPEDFDPQTDPIIRVEAGRLRLRLAEYYANAGSRDEVVIELPKGGYSLRCSRRSTQDGPALELYGTRSHYLRGRYLWNKRTTESLDQATACFRKALDEDCLDAAAWCGLADCYLVMGSFELLPPRVVFPPAIAAARKALDINPSLAEAHCSLAAAVGMYEWNSEEAFARFEKAIALNPDYASAWHFYGFLLFGRGLFERALHALEQAHSLDPLSSIIHVQLASLHYLTRDFKQAVKICEDVLRLDPGFWPARWFSGMALQQLGRPAEAYRMLATAVEASTRSPMSLAALGHLAGTNGQFDDAAALVHELEHRRTENHAPAIAIALVHLGCGDKRRALEWLTEAFEERSPYIASFLVSDPRLDPVRAEASYLRIVAELTARAAPYNRP